MKKAINIILIFIISVLMANTNIYANEEDFFELEFSVLENKEEKDLDIYLLLPKEYIIEAIKYDGLDIEYKGVETFKENNIPSINISNEEISDDVYLEDNTEYIQILLKPNEDGIYTFNILSGYLDKKIKFRIKSEDSDMIAYIEEPRIKDSKCKIEYNVNANTIKQPDEKVFSTNTLLALIVVIIIIAGIIFIYNKQKK